ncbi:uncharacterized protein C6orf163 homolog [Macrotis lagotis]|uniref:uncharacterized protein C6orf163 homolog n=1 Tax=Macrotis lagotis TaxID=92651 RepID=UPI003D6879FF
MIRNPDLQNFVCCAVCNKIIPTPPTDEALEQMLEYKPFKTRFFSHKDILDIGIKIHQKEDQIHADRLEEIIKAAQDEVWAKAEAVTDKAIKKAVEKVNNKHLEEIETLKEEHENELQEKVKLTRQEMRELIEEEMRRDNRAAEQRMVHRIQKILKECYDEKLQAIEEVRAEERQIATKLLNEEMRKNEEKILEAEILCNKNLEKAIKEATKATEHQMNLAFNLSQKTKEEAAKEAMKEVQTLHKAAIAEVSNKLTTSEDQLHEKSDELENMTRWKDFLEEELLETREAFQKYISVTFPILGPGQADFILPLRKTPPSYVQKYIEAHTEQVSS